MSDFNRALTYTLLNEGSEFTNNPKDPGGATKLGITLATLRRWRQGKGGPVVTPVDVDNLTLEEATEIYKACYWDEMNLDLIHDDAIATAIFDMGVNDGPGTSVQWAQHAVGVSVDGKLGQETADAINLFNKTNFFFAFISTVQRHYITDVITNPNQIEFLSGWLKRSQKLITLMG